MNPGGTIVNSGTSASGGSAYPRYPAPPTDSPAPRRAPTLPRAGIDSVTEGAQGSLLPTPDELANRARTLGLPGVGTAAILLVGLIVSYIGGRLPAVITSETTSQTAPEQYVDQGACPGEGCRYGEDWVTLGKVTLYTRPPTSVGSSPASWPVARRIVEGTWLRTLTGVIISKRARGKIAPRGSGEPSPLAVGTEVDVYGTGTEGCMRVWIDNRMSSECSLEVAQLPATEWWVQLRTGRGETGWTNDVSLFTSRAALNDSLAIVLGDASIDVSAKLAKLEVAMRRGADLNGDGGQYGRAPLEGAISANDTSLLRVLSQKGMLFRGKKLCAAYYATARALDEGGVETIGFLLNHGADVRCVKPTLQSFLLMRRPGPDYPLERAIAISEILVRHGAAVDEKNGNGQTVLDLLANDEWTERGAPLREALARLRSPGAGASAAQAATDRRESTLPESPRPSPTLVGSPPAAAPAAVVKAKVRDAAARIPEMTSDDVRSSLFPIDSFRLTVTPDRARAAVVAALRDSKEKGVTVDASGDGISSTLTRHGFVGLPAYYRYAVVLRGDDPETSTVVFRLIRYTVDFSQGTSGVMVPERSEERLVKHREDFVKRVRREVTRTP